MKSFVHERTNVLHLVLLAVAIAIAVAVTVAVPPGQQSAQAQDASTPGSYVVTDLGSLGGPSSIGGPSSTAIDINEAGQAVGWSHTSIGRNHAFLYDEDATPKMKDLGTVGGTSSQAFGINERAQVVGSSRYASNSDDEVHAFLYDEDATPKMMDLGALAPRESGAESINEAAQVVGQSTVSSEEAHAFLYDEDATPKMKDLGTLGGPSSATFDSAAFDINEAAQVVGYSNINEDDVHAFLYDASATPKMTDLGTLGGPSSVALGINNPGQIVGHSEISNLGEQHAFLYDASASPKMKDLGTLGGLSSGAQDVNDPGQVVGSAGISSNERHAFLYSNGQMVDLTSLIPSDSGWTLETAFAINNRGQIVGRGYHNGLARGFLLTPQKNYTFSGFFRPVDNPPTMNVVKAGSAVPLRFSLGGDEALHIFAEGDPNSRKIECSSSASPLDDPEQTLSAGTSGLSYDAATERYTYAWKTKKAWASSCRQLQMKLDDGTVHTANFRIR
jgi:probable HAF family extracellular repeat protein